MVYRKDIPKPTKEELEILYYVDLLSQREIASKIGVGQRTICKLMKDYGMSARTYSEANYTRFKTKPWLKEHIAKQRRASLKVSDPLRSAAKRINSAVRHSIMPLTRYHLAGAPCHFCGAKATNLHHEPPLDFLIREWLACEEDEAFIVVEIIRLHYTGEVGLVPLCKNCHFKVHYS